mmetsp:Transcript_8282/g.12747  ORF Transcript_8282/g.12747 Transcript_8282/m.12747 type:complete len:228 (-) Transcript_8282:193-876(-)|eukprot:CAMPEP_0178903860 /NCGR_PEP_ID=MMETSP0786-20121207/5383_1 /TAXON_ID=186022 /ORGANISM="Thalassionema frauenfeldii, Strain CCMP 1798" /LENGTH=227 /DNA_ID=CAMNT_0020575261 /DNA_START=227 /DNA_END=913 /DNA_ORIENTATION=+
MIQIEEILDRNNEGIEHISEGRSSAAKGAFRSAIEKLQAFYREQKHSKDTSQSRFIIVEPREISPSLKKDSQSKTHYIYQNALLALIDRSTPEEQGSKHQDCAGLTAILVFNLSIVYHCSIEHSESRSAYEKIIRLYKKAWDALQKDSCKRTKDRPYHDTIALGILNNMGALFHDVAKYRQAQHCFKALKSIVSSKSAGVLALNPDVRNGIILNVLFLDEPTAAIAA